MFLLNGPKFRYMIYTNSYISGIRSTGYHRAWLEPRTFISFERFGGNEKIDFAKKIDK